MSAAAPEPKSHSQNEDGETRAPMDSSVAWVGEKGKKPEPKDEPAKWVGSEDSANRLEAKEGENKNGDEVLKIIGKRNFEKCQRQIAENQSEDEQVQGQRTDETDFEGEFRTHSGHT